MANLSDLFPASGGSGNTFPIYDPGMLDFDGSTNYYKTTSATFSGNKVTLTFTMLGSTFTGNTYAAIFRAAGTTTRLAAEVFSSDYSTTAMQSKLRLTVRNSAGTTICELFSSVDALDGNQHTVFFAFDGDNGSAVFRVDGVDADETGNTSRVAPTTGTLETGSSKTISFGARHQDGANKFTGSLGFFGYADIYGTWSDFMDANGNPLKQDETTWANSGWGSQPIVWNENGQPSDNRGSNSDLTAYGTVVVADVEEVTATDYGLGPAYQPAMMQFNGSTGYYSKTSGFTVSGNKVAITARFKISPFTGDVVEYVGTVLGNSQVRCGVLVVSSDYSSLPNRRNKVQFFVYNSAGTLICSLISPTGYVDGNEHTLFASFDGDNGTATYYIDGSNADDTGNADRTAPTTGTLGTSTPAIYVGRDAGSSYWSGAVGFFGYDDQYLTNWSDFMDSSGNPIDQDETTWANSGWGSQPLFWNEHGQMSNNQGSAGDMTESGTIVVAPTS